MLSVNCRYIKGNSRTVRLFRVNSLPRRTPNNLQIYPHERKHRFCMPHSCSHFDVNPPLYSSMLSICRSCKNRHSERLFSIQMRIALHDLYRTLLKAFFWTYLSNLFSLGETAVLRVFEVAEFESVVKCEVEPFLVALGPIFA